MTHYLTSELNLETASYFLACQENSEYPRKIQTGYRAMGPMGSRVSSLVNIGICSNVAKLDNL